jgi:Na+/melibiose symporter-like transporter
LLWFALSLHWSALLAIILPQLVEGFVPAEVKGTYATLLFAAGAIVSTLVQMYVGWRSDHSSHRFGRRRPFIAAGLLLNLGPLLLLPFVRSFEALLLAFLGIQVFLNIANGPYQALIPDLVPRERHGLASAHMGLNTILGQAGGLALAGLLTGGSPVLLGGLGASARLLIVTGTIAGVLVVCGVVTIGKVKEEPPPRQAGAGFLRSLGLMFDLRLRQHPDFVWLIISRFFINMAFYTATFFLRFYVKDTLGAGERAEFFTFAIMGIATVSALVGNWPAGILADRTSKKRVIYVSCCFTGAAALLFLLTSSLRLALGAAFFFGIGFGAFAAVDWALACNLLPAGDPARYLGVWHFAFTLPQVAAPLAVGPAADAINRARGLGVGWRLAMFSILVYLVIGVLTVMPIREKKARSGGEA